MKKVAMLAMACSVVGMSMSSMSSVCSAASLPPAGELTVSHSGPELSVVFSADEAEISFPLAKEQKKKVSKTGWQMNASVAYFSEGKWYLRAEEGDRYEIKTKMSQDGDVVIGKIKTPKNGCGWFRFWGKNSSSGDWLWIVNYSSYYRLSSKEEPGYELLICSDEKVYPVPSDYPRRP